LAYLIQEVIKSATSNVFRLGQPQLEHAKTDVEDLASEESGQEENESICSDEGPRNISSNEVSKEERKIFARKANLLLGNAHLKKKVKVLEKKAHRKRRQWFKE